jgi:hypothetical protein
MGASVNAAQQQSSLICYRCGEPGHIATNCPTKSTTVPNTSSTQRPRTAPPARGHAAAAQEGENTNGSTSSTGGNNSRGSSSRNAMVCTARAFRYEQAMSARRVLDYNASPHLRQPTPQPIPAPNVDHEGAHFLDVDRYVTMVLPINRGQFNPILERHIASGIVPPDYYGNLNPLDDDFWVLLHAYPLPDVDRSFAVITHPQGREGAVIAEGVIPILQVRFGITIEECNNCVTRFCTFINAYLSYRFNNCDYDAPVTVTSRNATLCITFYPRSHKTPILIRDGNDTCIVPERAIPGHWIDDTTSEMSITWAGDLSDSNEEDV